MKYLLYFSCCIIIACFSTNKDQHKVSDKDNTPAFSHTEPVDISSSKSNDSIIWNDQKIKLYAHHEMIERGEEQIVIFNEKTDTLLVFNHEDGGRLTFPFIVGIKEQLFVNFFEVWEGSGFSSKKRFYHLNSNKNILEEVNVVDHIDILKKIKKKFSIQDSIYTRKGELYKDFLFDKNCFNSKGELPFTLIIFNQSNPDLNNGLEGFKKLKGVYKFEEKNNEYFLTLKNLTLEN
ncbi:hypothetical protein [Aquimarina sp. AU58]|uniref:hypothetical protein n=1 Tax=Aquimarina sp. AU58 TaxID=1874112 RepID=UPI001356BF2B|nr:hypothetical protein [Aquimarina sp. AU58]